MKPAAFLVCAACLCAQGQRPTELPTGSGRLEKERALGAKLAEDLRHNSTVLGDPLVGEYVQILARSLAERCSAEAPVEVQVLIANDPNGFVLPGGYIFLNSGLIRQAESEAELGGVVAHLIARAAGRDQSAAPPVTIHSSIPLILVGGWYATAYQQSSAAGTVPAAVAKRYRAAVLDADTRGLECLPQAGYDPEALLHNLKKLRPPDGGTHPPAVERIANAEAAIGTLPRKREAVLSTREFETVKRRLEALDAGTQPRRPAPSLYGMR